MNEIVVPDLTALLAASVSVALFAISRLRNWSSQAKPTVIVHTQDHQSIQGVLIRTDRTCLVLAQPEYLQAGRPFGLAGDVFIPVSNYAWHQEIPVTGLAAAGTGDHERVHAVS